MVVAKPPITGIIVAGDETKAAVVTDMCVDSNGNLYILIDETDLVGTTSETQTRLLLAHILTHSADDGKNFQLREIDYFNYIVTYPEISAYNSLTEAKLSVSEETLHIVWYAFDKELYKYYVICQSSSDGGNTWSEYTYIPPHVLLPGGCQWPSNFLITAEKGKKIYYFVDGVSDRRYLDLHYNEGSSWQKKRIHDFYADVSPIDTIEAYFRGETMLVQKINDKLYVVVKHMRKDKSLDLILYICNLNDYTWTQKAIKENNTLSIMIDKEENFYRLVKSESDSTLTLQKSSNFVDWEEIGKVPEIEKPTIFVTTTEFKIVGAKNNKKKWVVLSSSNGEWTEKNILEVKEGEFHGEVKIVLGPENKIYIAVSYKIPEAAHLYGPAIITYFSFLK
jgi:hypothetical protein